jgi:hypothetical protein
MGSTVAAALDAEMRFAMPEQTTTSKNTYNTVCTAIANASYDRLINDVQPDVASPVLASIQSVVLVPWAIWQQTSTSDSPIQNHRPGP